MHRIMLSINNEYVEDVGEGDHWTSLGPNKGLANGPMQNVLKQSMNCGPGLAQQWTGRVCVPVLRL